MKPVKAVKTPGENRNSILSPGNIPADHELLDLLAVSHREYIARGSCRLPTVDCRLPTVAVKAGKEVKPVKMA
jgi:hypothetical protein